MSRPRAHAVPAITTWIFKTLLYSPSRTPFADRGSPSATSFAVSLSRKGSRPAVQVGRGPDRFSPGSSPSPEAFSSGIAEGKHPRPLICIGQALLGPSAVWMHRPPKMGTIFFLFESAGPKALKRDFSLSSGMTNSTTCFPVRPFAAFLWVSVWVRLEAGELSVS